MKGIQVSLDKETNSYQRVDYHKNENIRWGHLEILFSRTNDPEKLKFS
jgi:hypothetical protein